MYCRTTSPDIDRLLPLMRTKGVQVPVEEFHSAVNLAFHAYESRHYDNLHANMRRSLDQQFALLIGDLIQSESFPKRPLRILDIGCGTGQSAELLLQHLRSIPIAWLDLLDPSPEMLAHCARRESLRGVNTRFICGTLANLGQLSRYDLVLACSVLHHLPSLEELAAALHEFQRPGDVFLHFQDPNGAAVNSGRLKARIEKLEAAPETRIRHFFSGFRPSDAAERLRRMLGLAVPQSYIQMVNQELIANGIVSVPLTEAEVWSVTDLRVHDGQGISVDRLGRLLESYTLVSQRSYSFHGEFDSVVPARFRKIERELIQSRSLDGMHLAAAWKRTAGVE